MPSGPRCLGRSNVPSRSHSRVIPLPTKLLLRGRCNLRILPVLKTHFFFLLEKMSGFNTRGQRAEASFLDANAGQAAAVCVCARARAVCVHVCVHVLCVLRVCAVCMWYVCVLCVCCHIRPSLCMDKKDWASWHQRKTGMRLIYTVTFAVCHWENSWHISPEALGISVIFYGF